MTEKSKKTFSQSTHITMGDIQNGRKLNGTYSAKEYFCENMQSFIKENGLTKKAIAKSIDVSESVFNDYCNPQKSTFISAPAIIAFSINFQIANIMEWFTSIVTNVSVTAPSEADLLVRERYAKHLGTFNLCYYNSSCPKGKDNMGPSESLTFGILHIYEPDNAISNIPKKCIAVMGIDNRDEMNDIHQTFESLSNNPLDIISYVREKYSNKMYDGDFLIEESLCMLTLKHKNDEFHAYYHNPDTNGSSFNGGKALSLSVSRGREKDPVSLHIALSRKPFIMSDEDLHNNLLIDNDMSVTASIQQAEDLVKMFKNLYRNEGSDEYSFTERQKLIMIQSHISTIFLGLKRKENRSVRLSNSDDSDFYQNIIKPYNA